MAAVRVVQVPAIVAYFSIRRYINICTSITPLMIKITVSWQLM